MQQVAVWNQRAAPELASKTRINTSILVTANKFELCGEAYFISLRYAIFFVVNMDGKFPCAEEVNHVAVFSSKYCNDFVITFVPV